MKRYIPLLFPLLFLTTSPLLAQYYGVDEPFDSKWTLGGKVGAPFVLGEVDTELAGIYEVGLNVQKSLIRMMDMRLQLNAGQARGLDKVASTGFNKNSALNTVYDTLGGKVYHNFSMQAFDGSFQLKFNLNRLFGKEGGEAWDLYVFGGVGMMAYFTKVDALDDQNNDMPYPYSEITETDEQTVRTRLKGMLDGTYETRADQDVVNKSGFGNYALISFFPVGGGFRIKLSDNWAVGFEGRYNFTSDNLLDGQRWNENNMEITKSDNFASGSLTFDYTFNKD